MQIGAGSSSGDPIGIVTPSEEDVTSVDQSDAAVQLVRVIVVLSINSQGHLQNNKNK